MILRNEIGSEFWDIPEGEKENLVFPKDTQWFLSGRMALLHIIKDIRAKRKLETVALPSWCCESMIQPFTFHGVKIVFYPVTMRKDYSIDQGVESIQGCDAVLVLDYFGYHNLPDFTFDGVVIRDITHSVFSGYKFCHAEYVFGSLRKWAGFYTGGFAYCADGFTIPAISEKNSSYTARRQDAMVLKTNYMRGKIEDKGYLSVFAEAEDYLDQLSLRGKIFAATERDIEIAHTLDTSAIKAQRRANAMVLLRRLSDFVLFKELRDGDCPLFVPITLPEGRDALRSYLISEQIYCPIHWPESNLHSLTQETRQIYEKELSLVCDQRYRESDMERLCDVILSYL